MSKTVTIIQIFVSSPADLAEERQAVKEVVDDLNSQLSQSTNIFLELIDWERYSYPDVGEDAQSVINEQLPGEYDIYLGMMGNRFGTPTGRAGSGTEEEFNQAYERYQSFPKSIRIMFYFKKEKIYLDEKGLDQLKKVLDFKKKIRGKGVFAREFLESDNFQLKLSGYLMKQINEFGKTWGGTASSPSQAITSNENSPSESVSGKTKEPSDEGLFDLLELGQEAFEKSNTATSKMAEEILLIGERAEASNKELVELIAKDASSAQKKAAINRYAEDLKMFAYNMEKLVPDWKEPFSSGMRAYGKTFAISRELEVDEEETKESLDALKNMIAAFRDTLNSQKVMRETIADIPRLTTKLNIAKKKSLDVLDKLIYELEDAIGLAKEVEGNLEEMLSVKK